MSDDLSRTRNGRSIWESVWRGIKFNRLLFQGQKLPQIVTSQVYIPPKAVKKCFGFGESNTKSLLCIHRVSFTFPLPSYIRPFLLFVTPHPNFPDRRRGMQRRDASHKKTRVYSSIIRENGDINEIAAADINQQQTN